MEDVKRSIDNYKALETPIKNDTIPQKFEGHPLSNAILTKYQSPDGLDRQKLYNLCKAITININGLLGTLKNIIKISDEDGDIEIIEKV